jgi:phosphoglycerate dehydrogenase-like enzyme
MPGKLFSRPANPFRQVKDPAMRLNEVGRKLLILTYHQLDLWIAPVWFGQRLKAEFPQFDILQLNSYDGVAKEISDIEVLFGFSLRPEQFQAARKLRWIHSPAAAVHQLMFPELRMSQVIVTNAREVHGPVVAEHVLALMFSLAKQIPQSVRFQQRHEWGQEALWRGDSSPGSNSRPRELQGSTLGLVGFGSIGRQVAKRGAQLGMRVVAVREHLNGEKTDFVDQVLPSSALEGMLRVADYVVLAAPVTPSTQGMISRRELRSMKPDAVLINVGRGALVDEGALVEALREKTIRGAALDVFSEEPLPAESPLWDLDNLLITPHIAGMTEKLWERHYALFSANLRRYLGGHPLVGLVDKNQGY